MAEANGKRILSLEDILHGLSDLAEAGDGAQRTQAYRMLLAHKGGAAAVLPDPLTDQERVERCARVMECVGKELAKLAYHRAFKRAKDEISDAPNLIAELLDPTLIAQAESIKTISQLYRWRPALKRPGILPGYPRSRGEAVQMRWCQNQAIKILLDEQVAAMEKAPDVKDDGTKAVESTQTPQ